MYMEIIYISVADLRMGVDRILWVFGIVMIPLQICSIFCSKKGRIESKTSFEGDFEQ